MKMPLFVNRQLNIKVIYVYPLIVQMKLFLGEGVVLPSLLPVSVNCFMTQANGSDR